MARIGGIESPEILAPGAPNYWQAAWQARRFVAKKAGREIPRQDLGLANNAASRRSQNQLHIHIDCVRADVKQRLAEAAGKIGSGIGSQWRPLPMPPADHRYLVRRIKSPDLAGVDPFRLLAEGVPAAAADMGEQTLVVIGADFGGGKEGFYILNDHAVPAAPRRGWGEELLDHDCAVLRQAP
jgi:CDP-diacylglycerol pyrophosphatase